jgi:hypothetical protein
MVSNTQQTKRIRARHRKRQGRRRKAILRKQSTPQFPVHPKGYDPNAADAKPAADA